jgi:TusA-related sulfurtransferase
MQQKESHIIARGLKPPGPLLVVKKRLGSVSHGRVRIIVSSQEAVDEITEYLKGLNANFELDRAGDDYHIVVDAARIKDGG